MQKRNIVITSLLTLAVLAIIIQGIFPAPKISDYCTRPSCLLAAEDILVGKNEDYFGQVVPLLLSAIGLGVLVTIFSLFFTKSRRWISLGLAIIISGVGYGILLRFSIVFGRWPMVAWIVSGLVIVVCGFLMFVQHGSKRTSLSI